MKDLYKHEEIEEKEKNESIHRLGMNKVLENANKRISVRIGQDFRASNYKEKLKSLGFTYDARHGTWTKTVCTEKEYEELRRFALLRKIKMTRF